MGGGRSGDGEEAKNSGQHRGRAEQVVGEVWSRTSASSIAADSSLIPKLPLISSTHSLAGSLIFLAAACDPV
jgi:hypothetical protein